MNWWGSAGSREWTVTTVIYAFFNAQKVKYEGRTGSLGLCCLPVKSSLGPADSALLFPSGVVEMDLIRLNTLKSIWFSNSSAFLPYASFSCTTGSSYLRRACSAPTIHLVFSEKKKKKRSLQFNVLLFFLFRSASKISERGPDLIFIDQSAVWPKCGPGLSGFCLLVQSGKCAEYTSETVPHRSALNGTQQALRSWLPQLFFLIQQKSSLFVCLSKNLGYFSPNYSVILG